MIPTKTYKEQNQSIMEILSLIYSGETKKARKILPNINMQYSTELHHVISLGTYNQTLKEKVEDLQKQVDELTTDLKKAIRDKEETKYKSRIKTGQTAEDAAKIKIFNLLENDDFNEIQRIVKDQKFQKFGKIMQQAWEYRWILQKYDQLMILKNKSSINKFKELTFHKDRKWLSTLILGTSETTVDINNQFAKILQAIDANSKVIIDTQKSLVLPVNKNLFLKILQKQQRLKSQLIKRCKDLSEIQDRIKQVYQRFNKTITPTDDTCADMVYKLTADYEQLKYDLEQKNPYSKQERTKSFEQKIGLIEFKYWFDWFITIIEANKLVSVNISKHLSEKEAYREKFQCIRQIIFNAIQSKKQGRTIREKQMIDRIQNTKLQLQNFNQNVVMSLQSLEKVGGALLEYGKISLQESVRILGKNIQIVLNELKYHRQQHLLLSEYKNKSITDKWQEEQIENFNLKSQKSEGYQQNEIVTKLQMEMSEVKRMNEESKESLIKQIFEKQSLIKELKKRIEEMQLETQAETNALKQKQIHMSKLQGKIFVLQKNIYESQIIESQILEDIDLSVAQIELKEKLTKLTLQHQQLKTQLEEKDKSIANLKNIGKEKLKSLQQKYEMKISQWRQKCKQYQEDLKSSYEDIRKLTEDQQEMMLLNRESIYKSRSSYSEDYKKQYQTQFIKNVQLQKQNEELKQQANNHKKHEVVQQGTGPSQILENSQKSKIQLLTKNSFKKEKNIQLSKQQPKLITNEIAIGPSQIIEGQSTQFLNYKIIGLEDTIKRLQEQNLKALNKQQELRVKQLSLKNIQMETLKKELGQITKKYMQIQADHVYGKFQNVNKLHLFTPCPGSIFLQQDNSQRLFLLDQLSHYLGQIRYTQLLYKVDNYNRTNFHKYIDTHRHLIVIAKTIYGKIFAGYTQQAFSSTGIKKGFGLIFSLWGRKVFEFRDKRAITYDDYYMIFGNSEIRIKSLEMKVFSNFGISNGYYDTRGQKVGALLGQGLERQVDLSHYEVYSLGVQDR